MQTGKGREGAAERKKVGGGGGGGGRVTTAVDTPSRPTSITHTPEYSATT